MSPIVEHPDVRRNAADHEGAHRRGARDLLHDRARRLDRAHREQRSRDARRTRSERASLLTPVAKAFSTDIGVEVASLGVQVHGGMGFIEETGAAQHLRDARIAPIYEGTNGIQAIDLVTRKLPLVGRRDGARADRRHAGDVDAPREGEHAGLRRIPRRACAMRIESLDRATSHLLQALVPAMRSGEALAGATPYLRLFALAQGGAALADMALAAIALMAGGDARSGACRPDRALPLLRREHRGRRAGPRGDGDGAAPASSTTQTGAGELIA